MKLFGQPVAGMYLWAIALLLLLAVYSAYTLSAFPYILVVAAILTPLLELLILYLTKKPLKVPWSGIITGLIIGEVAPINAPLLAIILASAVAMLSKHFLKVKSANVFNPATIGMLAGLGIFAIGDAWWGAVSIPAYGIAIPASIVLVIASYETSRLITSVSFIASVVVLSVLLGASASLSGLGISILDVNYFFALLMIADPKTSPHKRKAQATYGAGIGVLYTVLSGVMYSYFFALLIGNLAYALYRSRGHKLI